jgi:hypothetical protein
MDDKPTGLKAYDTVEHILGIPPERMNEITETIQTICEENETKAEAMVALSKTKSTDAEKVFMGFLLCKYYIATLFPPFISNQVFAKIG